MIATAYLVLDLVAELAMIALALVVVVCGFFVARRLHRDSVALLATIELQTRMTRHAVKNLAAALALEHVVADLDVVIPLEPDDDLAAR